MDQYEQDDLELAWEVMADTAKMAEISEMKARRADEDEIAAVIDAAFMAEAEAAKSRAEEAAARQRQAESDVERERARAEQPRQTGRLSGLDGKGSKATSSESARNASGKAAGCATDWIR